MSLVCFHSCPEAPVEERAGAVLSMKRLVAVRDEGFAALLGT